MRKRILSIVFYIGREEAPRDEEWPRAWCIAWAIWQFDDIGCGCALGLCAFSLVVQIQKPVDHDICIYSNSMSYKLIIFFGGEICFEVKLL